MPLGSGLTGDSASVDQATTSVETLTALVQQLVQNNEDLCSRIGNLESLPSNPNIQSSTSLDHDEDEDDTSTIRPKRVASDASVEENEPAMMAVTRYTFEQDLRKSRVYNRAMRRRSLESLLSSAALSFGWSCLSGMSLANVSNISVISLPIAVNELTNGEQYAPPPSQQTPKIRGIRFTAASADDLDEFKPSTTGSSVTGPRNHHGIQSNVGGGYKKIAILGQYLIQDSCIRSRSIGGENNIPSSILKS